MESHKDKEVRELSWQEVHDIIHKMWGGIDCYHCDPNVIVAIVRGGVIPALLMSREMDYNTVGECDLASIGYIKVVGYRDKVDTGERQVVGICSIPGVTSLPLWENKKPIVLLVDDICHKGTTLEAAQAAIVRDWPDVTFETAVLVRKEESRYLPTYVGIEVPNNIWIKFPWER